jgi:hypothetical protein
MSSMFPSASTGLRSGAVFSTAHWSGDRAPAADGARDAVASGTTSRADRLVPPEVVARYIESGDRLGSVLMGIQAWATTALAPFRRRKAAPRRRSA